MNTLTRRNLLTAASGIAAMAATSRIAFAQQNGTRQAPADGGPFVLAPLAYAPNALEPHIDAQTMQLHHDKHHAAAVTNLNKAAKEAPQIADHPIEHVLANLGKLPESVRKTVRNNLGSHANHTMFWQIMGPNGGAPEGDLLTALKRDLGGLEKLQADFNGAGGKVFGSGWVFVTVTGEGKLAIESRPNQDTPLMDGKRVLFGNDMWEHAYYLNYQNRRADYLKAWWNAVDWSKVASRYTQAGKGTLTI
jgi:superoxide dismutase, Fe-Mn family